MQETITCFEKRDELSGKLADFAAYHQSQPSVMRWSNMDFEGLSTMAKPWPKLKAKPLPKVEAKSPTKKSCLQVSLNLIPCTK